MPRHMAGSHLNIQRNTLATFDTAGMKLIQISVKLMIIFEL